MLEETQFIRRLNDSINEFKEKEKFFYREYSYEKNEKLKKSYL